MCFDGGTSHARGGLLLQTLCGKSKWHLPLLGQGANLARAAIRTVPEFGLAAQALSHSGKGKTFILKEYFFFPFPFAASLSLETSLHL